MPFDLFLSHAASFEKIDKPGLFRRSQKPITVEQFGGIFSSANATLRPDGDLWVPHPEDGAPWFAARLTPQGSIVLSCSYTNHRYIRNFLDAFDLGVRIAAAIDASLYEEVRHTRVDGTNIEPLLDVNGDYVQLQARTFATAVHKMDQESLAPLEYPMGPLDIVNEYFVLHLTLPPDAPKTLAEILSRAEFAEPPVATSEHFALFNGPSGVPATKLLLRPDGKVQIWSSHGEASFAETATSALAALATLEAAFPGATPALFGEPLSGTMKEELGQRAGGLGIEFFEWMQERHRR